MLALAVAWWFWAIPAQAQWIHQQGEDDPFAGGRQQLAVTVSGAGMLSAFRCTSEKDLALLFVTSEKPDAETRGILSKVPIKLLVIVDDDPKLTLDAELDTTPDGDRYRFTATSEQIVAIARRTAAAKRRFAVAVEILGQRLSSQAFGTSGSRRAIEALIRGCRLP
jgi:hypothetical protein